MQNELIKQNYKEKHPYSIVDKKHNTIFIYDTNNNLIKQEQIITGANNKDTDYSISMKDWLQQPENKVIL